MTGFTTSIQSGFARSSSEALFPRLFPDALWACPSLQSLGGTRLHDLRGGNWGTLTNMTSASDWVVSGGRGALDFDGSNDFVDFGNILNFERTQPFTISAWVRIASSANFGAIASKMLALGSGRGYLFSYESTRVLSFMLRNAASGNRLFIQTSAAALSLNTWAQVAVTYTGNSAPSGVAIYADGLPRATTTVENTLTGTILNSQSLNVAARTASNDGYINGQLDDIRFYNRFLTASEVRQLWQLGRGNMPMVRKRRYSEQEAAGFRAYWARRQSQLIGGNV